MPTTEHYCWTLNNPTPLEIQVLREINDINVRYRCWQQEIAPTTLTPHLQGYIELKNKKSMMWLKTIGFPARTHFEPRAGTRDEARDYTRKPETAIAGTWEEFGTWIAGRGARSDIDTLVERVTSGASDRELLDEMPGTFFRHMKAVTELRSRLMGDRSQKPFVRVYWGATRTGKTRGAYEWATSRGLSTHFQTMGTWWEGYLQQQVVILDDFGPDKAKKMGITYLLNLLDRYPMRVEIKGCSVPFNSPWIFITSNLRPQDWYPGLNPEQMAALEARFDEVVEFQPLPFQAHAMPANAGAGAGANPLGDVDIVDLSAED